MTRPKTDADDLRDQFIRDGIGAVGLLVACGMAILVLGALIGLLG